MDQLRLGDDNYEKIDTTYQDVVSKDIEKIKYYLSGFFLVPPKYYGKILCGTRVRYISHSGDFKFGGILVKNVAPDYLVLKNIKRNISWSVNLHKNHIYMDDIKERNREKIEKHNLYKLYKNGLVKILDEPHNSDEELEEEN